MKNTSTNIYNADGRKYTLIEYFKKINNEGLFQIISKKSGQTLITGTSKYVLGHLDNVYYGACIQEIAIDENGTCLYLR